MAKTARLLAALVLVALVLAACDDAGEPATTTSDPTATSLSPVVGGLTVDASAPVPLHPERAEEIGSVVVSDDGEFVVFAARQASTWTLYAADLDDGTPVVLHEALAGIGSIEIAPDNETVVYTAFRADGFQSLVATRLDGSLPLDLSDGTGTIEGFDPFAITADARRVVYRHVDFDSGIQSLRVVPLTGGVPVPIVEVVAPGHAGYSAVGPGFLVTEDSRRVVYLADPDGDLFDDLFVVPITGGAPTRLNDPPAGVGLAVGDFGLIPDGSRAVFSGPLADPAVREVYSVDLDAPGTPVRLNDDLPEGGSVLAYAISPAGDRIAFAVGEETGGAAGLFSSPVDGGGSILLAARPSGASPETLALGRFEIAPDGSRIAANTFSADAETVISMPIDGGEVIQINPDDTVGRLVGFTPDSQTIVVLIDGSLASAPAGGGAVRSLTAPLPVLQARTVEDDDVLAFTAGETVTSQGAYAVAPSGGRVVTIAEPDSGPEWPIAVVVGPGGDRVVYLRGTVTAGAGTTTGVYLVELS